MRHLRLFEGFNQDEYYQEITSEEFNDLEDNDGMNVDFSPKDREKLDIILNNNVGHRFSKTIRSSSYNSGGCLVLMLNDDYFSHVAIEPLEDDYYIVFTSNNKIDGSKYYKCDQWEGLMRLLKDKGIIK
jgi:hypothetical protein